ncbi:MAG: hypothetical protein ACP5G8_08605, partial [Athalassotoga sp.]
MAKLKLTREAIEKAQKLLASGMPQKHVAQFLGIAEQTWYEWLKKGSTQSGIYREFSESVKKAESEAIA